MPKKRGTRSKEAQERRELRGQDRRLKRQAEELADTQPEREQKFPKVSLVGWKELPPEREAPQIPPEATVAAKEESTSGGHLQIPKEDQQQEKESDSDSVDSNPLGADFDVDTDEDGW